MDKTKLLSETINEIYSSEQLEEMFKGFRAKGHLRKANKQINKATKQREKLEQFKKESAKSIGDASSSQMAAHLKKQNDNAIAAAEETIQGSVAKAKEHSEKRESLFARKHAKSIDKYLDNQGYRTKFDRKKKAKKTGDEELFNKLKQERLEQKIAQDNGNTTPVTASTPKFIKDKAKTSADLKKRLAAF